MSKINESYKWYFWMWLESGNGNVCGLAGGGLYLSAVCKFLMDAATSYHRHDHSETTEIYSFTVLQARCQTLSSWQVHAPSEASGEILLLASSGFWCPLPFLLADYSSLAFFFFCSLHLLLFVLSPLCPSPLLSKFSFAFLIYGTCHWI